MIPGIIEYEHLHSRYLNRVTSFVLWWIACAAS